MYYIFLCQCTVAKTKHRMRSRIEDFVCGMSVSMFNHNMLYELLTQLHMRGPHASVSVCLCHCKYCKRLKPPVEMVSDATTEIICQGEKKNGIQLFSLRVQMSACICFPFVFASSLALHFVFNYSRIDTYTDYCVTVLD